MWRPFPPQEWAASLLMQAALAFLCPSHQTDWVITLEKNISTDKMQGSILPVGNVYCHEPKSLRADIATAPTFPCFRSSHPSQSAGPSTPCPSPTLFLALQIPLPMDKAIQQLVPDHVGISLGGFGVSLGAHTCAWGLCTHEGTDASQAGWHVVGAPLCVSPPCPAKGDSQGLVLVPFPLSEVVEIASGLKIYWGIWGLREGWEGEEA